MKLEYLADGSPDRPLIRLYDFTAAEAGGAAERVEFHRLPFVEPVGGCRLALVCGSWDQSVIRGSGRAEFECRFTAGNWDNVAGLVEPFAASAVGFQWLAGSPGESALLLSVSGQW